MLTVKSVPITNRVFFMLLFLLIKTKSPNPAEDESPATVEPRLITPLINIVVIKTFPGHANTVCNAIDNLNLNEVLGTVAGDNCMFACLREGVTGEQFLEHLKKHIPGIED